MYATSSPAGFNVYRSEDLVSWENLGLCYDGLKGWGFMDFWAPEVVEYNGGYAMFFTAKSKALNALRTGVAFAQSPSDPLSTRARRCSISDIRRSTQAPSSTRTGRCTCTMCAIAATT